MCAEQELQCGERGEGPGGSKEDAVSRRQDQLSAEDVQHSVDGHRGTHHVQEPILVVLKDCGRKSALPATMFNSPMEIHF